MDAGRLIEIDEFKEREPDDSGGRLGRWSRLAAVAVASLSVLGCFLVGCGGKAGLSHSGEDVGKTPAFAEESISKLENQSSFRYRHQFHREGPPFALEGSFEGACVFPDRKTVKGRLTMGDKSQQLDFVASGDSEYHLDPDTGDWVERPASQEACPLAQLGRTVGLGGFEYLGRDRVGGKAASLYSFEPSLAFLDPTMEKELVGRMWVLESSGLPVKVAVRSKDGSLAWDMTLFGFNSPISISIPLKKRYEAEFAVGPDGREGLTRTADILSERLSLLELADVRLRSKSNEKLLFNFDSESGRKEMIELVSEPGSLRVRLALWPEGPVSTLSDDDVKGTYGSDSELTHEMGNIANALILTDDVLTSSDVVGARLVYDEFSRPVVEIGYSTETSKGVEAATRGHVGKPLAFALDGRVLHAPVVRRGIAGNHLRIGGFTSVTLAHAVSVVLKTDPLPLGVRLVSVEEASR